MKLRPIRPDDHELVAQLFRVIDDIVLPPAHEGWVSDNEEGPRYWVMVEPFLYGQFRIQVWWERWRGMEYPDIFHQL